MFETIAMIARRPRRIALLNGTSSSGKSFIAAW